MKYILTENIKHILDERFRLNEDSDTERFDIHDLAFSLRTQFKRLAVARNTFNSDIFLRDNIIKLNQINRQIKQLYDNLSGREEELAKKYNEYLAVLDDLLNKRFEARLKHEASEGVANTFSTAVSTFRTMLGTKAKDASKWKGAINDAKTNFDTISGTINTYFKAFGDLNIRNDAEDTATLVNNFVKEKLVEKPAAEEEYRAYLIDRIVAKIPKNKNDSGFEDLNFALVLEKNRPLYDTYWHNLLDIKKQLEKLVGDESTEKLAPITEYSLYKETISTTTTLLDQAAQNASKILALYGTTKERKATEEEEAATKAKLASTVNWHDLYLEYGNTDEFWLGDATKPEPIKTGFIKFTFKDAADKVIEIKDDIIPDIIELGFNTDDNALLLFLRFAFKNGFNIDSDNYHVLREAIVSHELNRDDLRGQGIYEKGCIIFRKMLWDETQTTPDEIKRYINLQYQLKDKRDTLDTDTKKILADPQTARILISNIMLEKGNIADLSDPAIISKGVINSSPFRPVKDVENILSKLVKIEEKDKPEKAAIQSAEIEGMLKDSRLKNKDTIKKALVYLSDVWLADFTDTIERVNNASGRQLYALANTYHANATEKTAFNEIFKLRNFTYTRTQIQDLLIKLLKMAEIIK